LDSLEAHTRYGLYYSAKPFRMGFTLPRTRLIHDHLRPLSYLRLGPPTTFSTWTILLHMTLNDHLKCQDVTLLESVDHYIHYITIKRVSPWNSFILHVISQNKSYLIQNTSNQVLIYQHHSFIVSYIIFHN